MIGPDEYAVYNDKNRPGIGRDHLGNTYYNCFSIQLKRDSANGYLPYLFTDFITQYNEYSEYLNTCRSCISNHKILYFPAGECNINLSALERKFSHGEEVEESHYYYCPLLHDTLLECDFEINIAPKHPPAKPIQTILSGDGGDRDWDDEYLFEFCKISHAKHIHNCSLLSTLMTPQFISTQAEQRFMEMWLISMFLFMEAYRESENKIYWEEIDFDQFQSKLFNFIFPIPQTWVSVIPKPPPGVSWQEWEKRHKKEDYPQRVDFLFTYQGKRHIIELDDRNHYATFSGNTWTASEYQYRKTLSDTRWLKKCGFEIHRFTNEEIIELYNNNSSKKPDINGFINLLQTEGLEIDKMVFLKQRTGKKEDF